MTHSAWRPVEYRTARADDIPGIHSLWAASLWASVERLHADWTADPDPLRRAFVAVDGSGVLAVVCIVPRVLRNTLGEPQPVGGIAAVATRHDARRRGHARRLLQLAITAMSETGFAWSMLFTGTPQVYGSLGWTQVRLAAREGPLASGPGSPLRYRIRRATLSECRADLAAIYDQYNAHRPLSAVRTTDGWHGSAMRRLDDTDLFVAEMAGEITAYASVAWRDNVVELREIGLRPTHGPARHDLFAAIAGQAHARAITQVRAHLPSDVPLTGLATHTHTVESSTAMALPLRATWADILTVVDSPSATFWLADGF